MPLALNSEMRSALSNRIHDGVDGIRLRVYTWQRKKRFVRWWFGRVGPRGSARDYRVAGAPVRGEGRRDGGCDDRGRGGGHSRGRAATLIGSLRLLRGALGLGRHSDDGGGAGSALCGAGAAGQDHRLSRGDRGVHCRVSAWCRIGARALGSAPLGLILGLDATTKVSFLKIHPSSYTNP